MSLTCGFTGGSTEPHGVSASQSMIIRVRGASRRLRAYLPSPLSWFLAALGERHASQVNTEVLIPPGSTSPCQDIAR